MIFRLGSVELSKVLMDNSRPDRVWIVLDKALLVQIGLMDGCK